jgi:hypothetical protein
MSKANGKLSDTTNQFGAKPGKRRKAQHREEIGVPAAFEPNAAGIDIGAREIWVAVPADRDAHRVGKCGTFTADLREMAEWLVHCGVTTAAMESTGVYFALSSALFGRVEVPLALG